MRNAKRLLAALLLAAALILSSASCGGQTETAKDERDAVCAALKESLHEQIIALPEDGTWPFIKSVTLSEDGRSAEILSTKDLYKPERDNAAAQAVYIPALLYAAFTGEDAERFTVHFTVKDETTGDVLCTAS